MSARSPTKTLLLEGEGCLNDLFYLKEILEDEENINVYVF